MLFANDKNWYHFHKSFQEILTAIVAYSVKKGLTLIPATGYLCCPLITFENSLNPDQARHNVGPDLDQNCKTL